MAAEEKPKIPLPYCWSNNFDSDYLCTEMLFGAEISSASTRDSVKGREYQIRRSRTVLQKKSRLDARKTWYHVKSEAISIDIRAEQKSLDQHRAAGSRSALIVPLKQGNSPRRTLWRKAKRRPADPVEGNMSGTSRLDQHVTVTRPDSLGDHRGWRICRSKNRMR